jgi:transposase
LKKMAEEESRQTGKRKAKYSESGEWESRDNEERTLEAAQRNRQLANLHQFRVWLREAMEKRGRDIIEDETAYSSQICHKCSSAVEPSRELIVKCSGCGALFDQDKNTVRYYWGRFDEQTRAVAGSLASVKRSLLRKVWRAVKA